MLELLHQRLKETYDAGELRLLLTVDQVAALADEVGVSSEAEAVQLFLRLGQERYLSATGLDKPIHSGFQHLPFSIARVDRLTGRGLMEIGRLPNPGERMLQSLDAIEAAIDVRDDLSSDQKRAASQALEELKHFLRGLPPGVAVEVGSSFIRGLFS